MGTASPGQSCSGPYFVLHTETADQPSGGHFAGWAAAVRQAALPCLQLDLGRCVAIAGARGLDAEDDPRAWVNAIAGASLLVTTHEASLDMALRAGIPAVYVADGMPGAPRPWEATAPEHCRVVRSASAFRRDLPLRALFDAITTVASSCLTVAPNDTERRNRGVRGLAGRVLHLGHGGVKITRAAVGVDTFKVDDHDWRADVRDLWFIPDAYYDTVLCSAAVDELLHPAQALAEWTRILRPGGCLVFEDLTDAESRTVLALLAARGQTKPELGDTTNPLVLRKLVAVDPLPTAPELAPEISVLIVAELEAPESHAAALVTTVESAHASLGNLAHEILVLHRAPDSGDAYAAIHDLAARIPQCRIIADRTPWPYPRRFAELQAQARGRWIMVLSPGALVLGQGLRTLWSEATASRAAAASPRRVDATGRDLPPTHAADCLLFAAGAMPAATLRDCPYLTPLLWEHERRQLRAIDVTTAVIVTLGAAAKPLRHLSLAAWNFDHALLGRDLRAPVRSVLVVSLRTLGDCIFTTPTLHAIAQRFPGARMTVLTEARYAWLFERHPDVAEVLTVTISPREISLFAEDAIVTTAIAGQPFDRLVWMSPRIDSAAYSHGALTLQAYYAYQANAPEVALARPRLDLDPNAGTKAQAILLSHGVRGTYAVLHGHAGWPEKCLEPDLLGTVAEALIQRGLAVVAVGGPQEHVPHPAVVQLAGRLTADQSAAVVRGAAVFVGPDSSPLHMASAFDVPTVALYAGTAIRVAPPGATHAVSIQSPAACALPCSATPCSQAERCARHLTAAHVLPHLEALLARRAGRSEWVGHRPAVFAQSPRGVVTLPDYLGAPLPTPAPCQDLDQRPARTTPALRTQLGPIPTTEAYHERLWSALLGPAAEPPDRDFAAKLASTLAGLPPAAELAALETLGNGAFRHGFPEVALQHFCAAIGRLGALVDGHHGRPRSSLATSGDHLFRLAAGLALAAGEPLAAMDKLLALTHTALGQGPDPLLVAELITGLPNQPATHTALQCSTRTYLTSPRNDPRPTQLHGQVLTMVTARERLACFDTAEQLLTAHLQRLPPGSAEHALTVFRRGVVRARTGQCAQAEADFRAVDAHLLSPVWRAQHRACLALLDRQHSAAITASRTLQDAATV